MLLIRPAGRAEAAGAASEEAGAGAAGALEEGLPPQADRAKIIATARNRADKRFIFIPPEQNVFTFAGDFRLIIPFIAPKQKYKKAMSP